MKSCSDKGLLLPVPLFKAIVASCPFSRGQFSLEPAVPGQLSILSSAVWPKPGRKAIQLTTAPSELSVTPLLAALLPQGSEEYVLEIVSL